MIIRLTTGEKREQINARLSVALWAKVSKNEEWIDVVSSFCDGLNLDTSNTLIRGRSIVVDTKTSAHTRRRLALVFNKVNPPLLL